MYFDESVNGPRSAPRSPMRREARHRHGRPGRGRHDEDRGVRRARSEHARQATQAIRRARGAGQRHPRRPSGLGLQHRDGPALREPRLFLPDSEPDHGGLEPTIIEIPTVPTLLQQIRRPLREGRQRCPEPSSGIGCSRPASRRSRAFAISPARRSSAAWIGGRHARRLPEDDADRGARDRTADRFPQSHVRVSRVVVSDLGQDIRQVLSDTRPLMSSLKATSDTARSSVADIAQDVQKTLGDLRPLVGRLEAAADAARDGAREVADGAR